MNMFTLNDFASFRLTTEHLAPYPQGWAMKQDIPFRKRFSETILDLAAAGLIDK